MSAPPTNSIDVIFDLAKGRIDEQNARITTLDSKANFGVVSSILLISSAVGLRSALATAQKAGPVTDVEIAAWKLSVAGLINCLSVSALALFLVIVFCAFRAYQLRQYTVVPDVEALLTYYLDTPAADTKKTVTATWCEALGENEKTVTSKVRWTRAVLICLMVQAALLVLMALAQFAF